MPFPFPGLAHLQVRLPGTCSRDVNPGNQWSSVPQPPCNSDTNDVHLPLILLHFEGQRMHISAAPRYSGTAVRSYSENSVVRSAGNEPSLGVRCLVLEEK